MTEGPRSQRPGQQGDPGSVWIPVDGRFQLEGRLEGPVGGLPVVVCHPHPAFGGTMDTPIVAALAERLAAAGARVLRFNFRGIGRSEGKPTGGLDEHEDVRAACAFLRAPVARGAVDPSGPSTEIALAGYSFGGLMAARAIASGERVRRFAALALPTVIVGEDAARVADVIAANRAVPTLYVSGDRDQFSEIDRLQAFAAAAPGTRVEVLPGAGHFPTGPDLDAMLRLATTFLLD